MSTNLQGKVIAITGAGGGMGLETAKMCAARGAKVSVCDLHEPTLQTLSEEITSKGGEIMFQVVDITKEDQVNDWIEKTVQRFGPLDGAVNLAGTLGRKFRKCNTTNQDTEDWKLVLDINLNGVMYSQRAELRHMKDRGSIVNAASVAGWQGTPDGCAYGASKFGVIGLSKCAAVDVGPTRGIRVNAIAPGTIDTPMYQKVIEIQGKPVDRIQHIKRDGRADEIASLCCWLLCDESQFITGSVQTIDGGWCC